jgi:hypothetical protein
MIFFGRPAVDESCPGCGPMIDSFVNQLLTIIVVRDVYVFRIIDTYVDLQLTIVPSIDVLIMPNEHNHHPQSEISDPKTDR